jgi:hypothetical protein
MMNFLREVGAIDLAGGHLLFAAGVKNQKLFERASFFDLASENSQVAERSCATAFLLLLRRGKSRPAAAKTSIKFISQIR